MPSESQPRRSRPGRPSLPDPLGWSEVETDRKVSVLSTMVDVVLKQMRSSAPGKGGDAAPGI